MMLCGKKFVLLGWNSCSPNRVNKPQYSLDGISFRAWLKNSIQTVTVRHKGRKNLFPRMLAVKNAVAGGNGLSAGLFLLHLRIR